MNPILHINEEHTYIDDILEIDEVAQPQLCHPITALSSYTKLGKSMSIYRHLTHVDP